MQSDRHTDSQTDQQTKRQCLLYMLFSLDVGISNLYITLLKTGYRCDALLKGKHIDAKEFKCFGSTRVKVTTIYLHLI